MTKSVKMLDIDIDKMDERTRNWFIDLCRGDRPLSIVVVTDKELSLHRKKNKPATARKKFIEPTKEELSQYMMENNLVDFSQAFIDHYDSIGWLVGKGKRMVDWKATVRNWVRRTPSYKKEVKKSTFTED